MYGISVIGSYDMDYKAKYDFHRRMLSLGDWNK